MPSFEEIPSCQNNTKYGENTLARAIVNDKSGSLRLRIEKTALLNDQVNRGFKDVQNMQSPMSSDENKWSKSRLSD
jgi:hypothetical protein